MADPLIATTGIEVVYGGRRRRDGGRSGGNKVLHGVDIHIARRETVGIVGESGSGKSTLGRTLLRLTDVSAGKILFDGRDITGWSDDRVRPLRRRMQMIFQDPMSSLNPRHSIRRILTEPLLFHRVVSGDDDAEQRIRRFFNRVGLPPSCLDRAPHELSGGERQRVGIARAALLEPDFVLADEIVSGLDVSTQAQTLSLLKGLTREMGLAMAFISHDLSVIRAICDRVYVMRHGRIVEHGRCEDIFAAPRDAYTRFLIDAIPPTRIDPGWLDRGGGAGAACGTDDRREGETNGFQSTYSVGHYSGWFSSTAGALKNLIGVPSARNIPMNSNQVLNDLGSALLSGAVEVIDLTAPLGPETPLIKLPPEIGKNTPEIEIHSISKYDSDGPFWSWNWLKLGEHSGTHFDAPVHWITGKDHVNNTTDTIPPKNFVAPVCVIDCSAEVEKNSDFLLTVDGVKAWEKEHGDIPAGSWVLMRSDWYKRNANEAEFLNADDKGPHSPGPTAETINYLLSKGIIGWGNEAVGTDAGSAAGMDPAFPAHNLMHKNNRYGLASLCNLDRLPPTGAILIAAPLKIVNGTGSPLRVLALVPKG
jgi:isatin hydrolase